MKTLRNILAISLICVGAVSATASPARAVDIDFDKYAAVAYSPSTGKFGYAWNWHTRSKAEAVALSNCKAADAKVVGWVKAGWLVLVVADDNAYGIGTTFGLGASNTDAMSEALADCAKHTKSTTSPKIKVVVCSGNFAPDVRD